MIDKERIEREAFTRYPKKAINGFDFPEYNSRERSSYIAGATAENERMAELLKEERNKVIDECIVKMNNIESMHFVSTRCRMEGVKRRTRST